MKEKGPTTVQTWNAQDLVWFQLWGGLAQPKLDEEPEFREGKGGEAEITGTLGEKKREDQIVLIVFLATELVGIFADLLTGVFSAPRKTPPETERRSLFKSQVSLKFIPPALAPRNLWLRPDESDFLLRSS